MTDWYNSETFFRPAEVRRETTRLPANIYNQCRRLLGRAARGCVFVPIRQMQFMGVVDRDEVIFADSHGYRVVDGKGGRTILLAWRFAPAGERASLTEPVPCELIHYREGLDDVQRRLVTEFAHALGYLDGKSREAVDRGGHHNAHIVPLR